MSGSSTCPRCGAAFHCGVHDATPCACATLRVNTAVLAALRGSYSGCVCLKCLAQLATSGPPSCNPGNVTVTKLQRTS